MHRHGPPSLPTGMLTYLVHQLSAPWKAGVLYLMSLLVSLIMAVTDFVEPVAFEILIALSTVWILSFAAGYIRAGRRLARRRICKEVTVASITINPSHPYSRATDRP